MRFISPTSKQMTRRSAAVISRRQTSSDWLDVVGSVRRSVILSTCGIATLFGCNSRSDVPPSREDLAAIAKSEPLFQEWPEFARIARAHVSSDQSFEMPGIMGSGCAMIDLNGDDRLDLIIVAGDLPQSAATSAENLCQVLLQMPEGQFRDVSAQAKISVRGFGMGVFGGDIDNDGDTDVLTTSSTGTTLWRNDGDIRFTDITSYAGLASSRWSTAAAFHDFDRDGWLDLLIVNYVDYFSGSICTDGSGRRDYCGPQSFSGTADQLLRNLGSEGAPGKFEDITVRSGIAGRMGKGLGTVCSDFNGDRRSDIYVANDMEPNFLWIQQENGNFEEEGSLRGCSVDLQGRRQASMGTAWADFDGDGLQDLFLTHLRGETNTLYRQLPGGVYVDQTSLTKLGEASLNSTGFGVVSGDLNLDGHIDFAITNGRVMRAPLLHPEATVSHWQDYSENNQLFMGTGAGAFRIASAGSDPFLLPNETSRGLAMGDLDNDGDLDLLVSSAATLPRLYENTTNRGGNWLMVRLRNPAWNRDAVGARLKLSAGGKRWTGEVMPNVGYLSCHDTRIHFGLGRVDSWDSIIVYWPDDVSGAEAFGPGPVNQPLVLEKGQGRPVSQEVTDGESP